VDTVVTLRLMTQGEDWYQ